MSSFAKFAWKYLQYDNSISHIVEQYCYWVADDKYMALSCEDSSGTKVFGVKLAKRGNDVYRYRVYKRFKTLMQNIGDTRFFNPKDRGKKKTKALFITLTYDTKLCSWQDAWVNIGKEFNKFKANLTKRFGRVSHSRAWESFENGYPHIHCVLVFENFEFNVFRDRKGEFRVSSKRIFEKYWHSFIDVKAIYDLRAGMRYVGKYLYKSIDAENATSKSMKTLALCWAFGKRAFSIGGKFREILSIFTEVLNQDIDSKVCDIKYLVLGFFSAQDVGLKENVWYFELDENMIELLSSNWRVR